MAPKGCLKTTFLFVKNIFYQDKFLWEFDLAEFESRFSLCHFITLKLTALPTFKTFKVSIIFKLILSENKKCAHIRQIIYDLFKGEQKSNFCFFGFLPVVTSKSRLCHSSCCKQLVRFTKEKKEL